MLGAAPSSYTDFFYEGSIIFSPFAGLQHCISRNNNKPFRNLAGSLASTGENSGIAPLTLFKVLLSLQNFGIRKHQFSGL